MTYCFRCPLCGYAIETTSRDPAPTCAVGKHDPEFMIRDWSAEGVMIDKFAFREGRGTPESPGGIRKRLVSPNIPDPY